MREPPVGVTDAAVLATVQEHWCSAALTVSHLPVGFGAHHWRVETADGARLFVTMDTFGARHDRDSLRAAYAGAASLAAAGLEFVVAPLPPYTVPFGHAAALSATPWLTGSTVGTGAVVDPERDAAVLRRLHAARPGPIPMWEPLVAADFAGRLRRRLDSRWDTGPFGPQAREALLGRIEAVADWTARYHRLAELAGGREWVPTHGEPHTRNQLRLTDGRVVLVDWESLKLAPRERDLGGIVQAGRADLVDPDSRLLELFDLEWRLDEISQYATWFEAAHTGSASDEVAMGGLLEELNRPG